HPQEDTAVAASFAEHGDLVGDTDAVRRVDRVRIELDLLAVQRNELGDAASGGGEELEERAVAEAVVGRGVEALHEPLELLLVEVPRVGARIWRLTELDLLRTRNRQIEQHAELQQAAQGDEVHVLRSGRNWSLADVTAREESAARQ